MTAVRPHQPEPAHADADQRRRRPRPVRTIRRLLGLCSTCWHRAAFTVDMVLRDAADNARGGTTLDLCRRHGEQLLDAAAPIAQSVRAEFASGVVLECDHTSFVEPADKGIVQ